MNLEPTMTAHKPPTRKAHTRVVPRVAGRQAAKILKECDSLLLQSGDLLTHLPRLGFAALLATITDDILRLALQPDSWGERTRARLMSDIAPALQGDVSSQHPVNIDDIAHCANIVMPCLLLELGRRQQHIEIDFPLDPTDSSARFRFRAGKSFPVHAINNGQLVHLATSVGEALVGLCSFGDEKNRASVEAALTGERAA